MSNYIIDEIQPTAWRLRIRDESTGKTEEVALRPGEPWKVRVGGAGAAKPADKTPASAQTSKPATPKQSTSAAPKRQAEETPAKATEPKNEGIKLALENGSGNTVVATAHGKAASAWAKAHKRLLGRRWDETAEGNPFVILKSSPTLVQDIETALPGVRIDTKHYTPPAAPRPATAAEPSKAADPEKDKERKVEAPPAKAAEPAKPAPGARKASDKRKKSKTGKPSKLQPGNGPGGLEWAEIRDEGNRGIVAPWQQGQFKILRAGAGTYALFYEYARGGYEQLACGKPDALKQVASERTTGNGQRVTEALARGACKSCEPQATEPEQAANEPTKRTPEPAPPPAPEPTPAPEPAPAPSPEAGDASRDGELMSGFRKELAGIFDEEDD